MFFGPCLSCEREHKFQALSLRQFRVLKRVQQHDVVFRDPAQVVKEGFAVLWWYVFEHVAGDDHVERTRPERQARAIESVEIRLDDEVFRARKENAELADTTADIQQ